ncbi:hypothetical protein DFJ73DRAFT_340169 [Zopfochytrium polystomum]|nr:hypothetical protein DFJ73DRAFT_340169 [Zopfochytrium polystomum]
MAIKTDVHAAWIFYVFHGTERKFHEDAFWLPTAFHDETASAKDSQTKAFYLYIKSYFETIRKEGVDLNVFLSQCGRLWRSTKPRVIEFEVRPKTTWITFQTSLQGIVVFCPKTPQDGTFDLETVIERANRLCVDSKFIHQLETCLAFQLAMQSDYIRAKLLLESWTEPWFNRSQALGLNEVGANVKMIVAANVVCTCAILVERRDLPASCLDLFYIFASYYAEVLENAPIQYVPAIQMHSFVVSTVLIGLEISMYDNDPLELQQRNQVLSAIRVVAKSMRILSSRYRKRYFFAVFHGKFSRLSSLLYSGKLTKFESEMKRLLALAKGRIPDNIDLMLQARLLRLQTLREGKEAVRASVSLLLAKFENCDNKCDPDLLKKLCCG